MASQKNDDESRPSSPQDSHRGQPRANQPHPTQAEPNQPYLNQPYPAQPSPNQPNPNQPYPNQPYPSQPNPNQPYLNQTYLNQPYPNQPYQTQPYQTQPYPYQFQRIQGYPPLSYYVYPPQSYSNRQYSDQPYSEQPSPTRVREGEQIIPTQEKESDMDEEKERERKREKRQLKKQLAKEKEDRRKRKEKRNKTSCGFVTCGPNEALVISGWCYSTPRLVVGGRAFIWCGRQMCQSINLNTMTLPIESPRVYTSQGIPISVTGIAQVRIQGQNEELLRTACELFLDKTEEEIRQVALETLEGHQRAIMGTMTVEEIYKDRKKFSENVFTVASSDLINMGLTIVSYTIKDIWDDQGYLKSLGMARTAQVQRDARIGEAFHQSEAEIKKSLAKEKEKEAEFRNLIKVEEARRNFELKKAAYDVEVFTKTAESDLAYELQAAKIKQDIIAEKVQIEVIERKQLIALAEQEMIRQEQMMDAAIRQPAAAEKYRLERLAEANKRAVLLEAEAEAEKTRLMGEAEAKAIYLKAKAEADVMADKAKAWNEYREAATVNMLLESLPNKQPSGYFIDRLLISLKGCQRSCKPFERNQEDYHGF